MRILVKPVHDCVAASGGDARHLVGHAGRERDKRSPSGDDVYGIALLGKQPQDATAESAGRLGSYT